MANKRNRILDLTNYLESIGITVNIAKNKAQGKKGFFKVKNNNYRIDIAKGLDEEETIRTLSHEFAHYIHYQNDKTLKSLSFIFPDNDDVLEELISITVNSILKDSIKPIFNEIEKLKKEITFYTEDIKKDIPEFKEGSNCDVLEKKIKKTSLKYLLKKDVVKIIGPFSSEILNVNLLEGNSIEEKYVLLKSKQRLLKRLRTRVSTLNKYYNTPTELFARSFEAFIYEENYLKENSPIIYNCYKKFTKKINNDAVNGFISLLKKQ